MHRTKSILYCSVRQLARNATKCGKIIMTLTGSLAFPDFSAWFMHMSRFSCSGRPVILHGSGQVFDSSWILIRTQSIYGSRYHWGPILFLDRVIRHLLHASTPNPQPQASEQAVFTFQFIWDDISMIKAANNICKALSRSAWRSDIVVAGQWPQNDNMSQNGIAALSSAIMWLVWR